VSDTPIVIIGIQDMLHWFSIHEIPNSFTLIIEVAISVGIALYLFYLQFKTSKIRDAVTDQIKQYTEEKRKLEINRKNFYIKRIKGILEYIKTQDIK
jgi:hypothetical protein